MDKINYEYGSICPRCFSRNTESISHGFWKCIYCKFEWNEQNISNHIKKQIRQQYLNTLKKQCKKCGRLVSKVNLEILKETYSKEPITLLCKIKYFCGSCQLFLDKNLNEVKKRSEKNNG